MGLDVLCQELASKTSYDESDAWEELVTKGNLWRLCKEAVEAASFAMLEKCYKYLAEGNSLSPAQRQSRDELEAAYLNTTIQRVVAAAAVTLLARHSATFSQLHAELPRWAYHAAALADPPASVSLLLDTSVLSDSEESLIHRSFELIAGDCDAGPWSLARAAALMLGESVTTDRQFSHIPILLVQEEQGYVAYLSLHQLSRGKGQLVRSPRMFRSVGALFRKAFEQVWLCVGSRFSDADVCWDVHMDTPIGLDGASVQAALQAGLLLLADGALYDRDCAISATVDPAGKLGEVQGIVGDHGTAGPKLNAAVGAGVRRVIVSRADYERLTEQTRETLAQRGLQVLPADTIQQATELVSHTVTEMRRYLVRVKDAPDQRDQLPAYLGWRTLTELYIEPDVLKRVPGSASSRTAGPREDASSARERGSDPRAHLAAEALDIGELLFGEREDRQQWQRVPWSNELLLVQCVVVLAPPGQGKSLLTQMRGRGLAANAIQRLDGQEIGLAEAPLPILVRLKVLAKHGVSGEPEQALRDAIRNALVADGYSSEAARYLAEHAHEERVWLLLDALDEVEAEDREKLKLLLAALKGPRWTCHVLLTSRPYGYSNEFDGLSVTEYRLAEFSLEQSQAFIRRWFQRRMNGDDRQARMLALLANSAAIQRMSQSPFLLTLLCWIVERDPVVSASSSEDPLAKLTRTQLYERAVSDLLGMQENGSVDRQRAALWMPLISEITLTSFIENAALRPLMVDRLLEAIKESEERPPILGAPADLSTSEKAVALLDELRKKRFLVPLDAERSQYVFPHRSLLEFLAGWRLAKLANKAGWTEIAELVDRRCWHPDWEEVILFLAGSLEDPIPLLELLSDKRRDDYFRHRLALAALCLPEIAALQEDESATTGGTQP